MNSESQLSQAWQENLKLADRLTQAEAQVAQLRQELEIAALKVKVEGLQGAYALACRDNGELKAREARLRELLKDAADHIEGIRAFSDAYGSQEEGRGNHHANDVMMLRLRATLADPTGQPK